MNKKAQVFSAITASAEVLVGMFMFAVMSVFMAFILFKFHSSVVGMDFFNVPVLGSTLEFMLAYPSLMDWVALLTYGVVFALTLWGMSKVEVGTGTYVLSFFVLFIVSFGFYAMGVVLDAFMNSVLFTDVTTSMVFLPFFAANALLFTILYAFISLMVMHMPTQ